MPAPFSLPYEETLGSRRGFDGHLLHVRVDDVRLPSGRTSVREVVEHPGSVAVLGITLDDEVILIRQWRHAIGQTLLEIPAGTCEPAETPEATARRELLEETGFDAGTLEHFAMIFPTPGYSNEEMHLYFAPRCVRVGRDEGPDERTEVVLAPAAELHGLIPQIRDAPALTALLWFIARASLTPVRGALE